MCLVTHLNGMAFNRDAALTFQIHVIQHLAFCDLNRFCLLQQTIGKCRFAMVYMCNNTKVSYIIYRFHSAEKLLLRAKLTKFL